MRLQRIGWAVAGLSAFASAGIALSRPFGYDLVAYLAAARRVVEARPLYPLAAEETIYLGAGEYLYPPTSAVGFVPLALLPVEIAIAIWTTVLVAIAAWIAYELVRPLPPWIRPWAAAGFALYLPLIAEITLGNLNLVTLALCLAAWRWRARPLAGGGALALAVGSKLLPLALPLFFVAARAGRLLAMFALATVAGVAATLPWLADAWPDYLRLLVQINGVPPTQATTLVPAAIPAPRIVLPVICVALVLFSGHVGRDPRRAATAYAVALAALPLAAPGIWYPYLVFALPLLAALLRAPERWGTVGAVAAFLALEIPKRAGGPDVAFLGLVLLIAVGVAHLVRSGAPDPGGPPART